MEQKKFYDMEGNERSIHWMIKNEPEWAANIILYYSSMIEQVDGLVISDVIAERSRQDKKWGGASHDDQHSVSEFIQWINDYAGWARMMDSMMSKDKARKRLIQVAALAVAAVESIDRKRS